MTLLSDDNCVRVENVIALFSATLTYRVSDNSNFDRAMIRKILIATDASSRAS